MSTPAWMKHPCLLRVLGKLLDLLDQLPAAERSRDVSIMLNVRVAPEIYASRHPGDAEFAWATIKEAERHGWVDIKLGKKRGIGFEEFENDPRIIFNLAFEDEIRKHLDRPVTVTAGQAWREAVLFHYEGSVEAKEFLAGQAPIVIPGRTFQEIVVRLNLLPELLNQGLYLREASSRMFWGLSKVLDHRMAMLSMLTGLEEPFAEVPVQLHVHAIAAPPQGILIIENLTVFEAACRGRFEEMQGLILVYGAGFKSSARRLRTPEGSSLFYTAAIVREAPQVAGLFEDWLYQRHTELPVHFWGDLDFSGMAILRELRRSIPDVAAWEHGYAPMLEKLEAGLGHLPGEARKEGQGDPGETGCTFADTVLLPALRKHGRFMDQE